MIVALRGGVLRVTGGGSADEALFVPGGFAEITPERCTVLADEATPLASLSRSEAERRLAEAETALAATPATDPPAKRDAALGRVLSMQAMRDAAEAA
jgi:F-type H+-transporting ATPase subunit epsilon